MQERASGTFFQWNPDPHVGNSRILGLFSEQARIRESLKALKGTAKEKALTERYPRQLNDPETQLARLRSEMAGLETKRKAAQERFDRLIGHTSLTVAM